MTTAVVEMIDAEVVEDALSPAAAKKIDTEIRKTVSSIETDMASLYSLLAEAKAGSIHVALGFESWTAYMADAVTLRPKDKLERKELVALLSGEGLSTRAIAEIIPNTSRATVGRDAAEAAGSNEPADKKVTGLDGVEQPKKKKATPKPKADKKTDVEEDEGPKVPAALKSKLDPAVCDADNVIDDLATLTVTLTKLYESAAWKSNPALDKELRDKLTQIRKAMADLPKRPKAATK